MIRPTIKATGIDRANQTNSATTKGMAYLVSAEILAGHRGTSKVIP